jgi:hypothetical protein
MAFGQEGRNGVMEETKKLGGCCQHLLEIYEPLDFQINSRKVKLRGFG